MQAPTATTPRHLSTHEQLKAICAFLTAYGTALHSSGATAHRICVVLERIAAFHHVGLHCSVLPARLLLTVSDADGRHTYTQVGRTRASGINLRVNAELNALADRMERERLTLQQSEPLLREILSRPRISPWLVTPLVGCANASFCRLFGGDTISMGIVWLATVVGFALKHKLMSLGIDARLVTLLSAVVAVVVSTAGYVAGWGATPMTAIATSVLFLVPGIPYINGLTDMLTGHHLVAMSRFVDAVVTTICLALGLVIGLGLTEINYLYFTK